MTEYMEKVLEYLSQHEEVNTLELSNIFNVDHQKIIGAIKGLEAYENLISVESTSQKELILTEEGEYVLKHGSHEVAVFNAIPNDTNEIKQSELLEKVPYAKVGLSKAKAAKWIEIGQVDGEVIVKKSISSISDEVQKNLNNLQTLSDDFKKEYKKRKLIKEQIIKIFVIRKGINFSIKIEKPEAYLSADLLMNDAWKSKKFKPINLNALGVAPDAGHLHPLLKVRSEFRKIFLEMGFQEMPTNNYVENSFWNFDALFQPQQHPARDAHDTFFVSDPAKSSNIPEDYLAKVKKVHSEGGYGSQGYKYDWKLEEAQKNLFRTHTTAVSARMLYKLIKKGKFEPVRYFSIDRVFRNETLDATHLAEFHQVEGVVADYNLTLGDLIGTLYAFFNKLGITQLEFKPAYNPYTEPSMEIFCFHTGLNKWIEIGNSGIFRPEMLLPMGIPENVNVIAWGLSLERPTMIKYGLNNIRDLVGPKVDLQMVHNNPLCRLDKYNDSSVSEKLFEIPIEDEIKCQNYELNEDLVIFCDPDNLPYYLENIFILLNKVFSCKLSLHYHSSAISYNSKSELKDFHKKLNVCLSNNDNTLPKLSIVYIWKKDLSLNELISLTISKINKIDGIVNVTKCLTRLIEYRKPSLLRYESLGADNAYKIDKILNKISNIKKFNQDSFNKLLKKEFNNKEFQDFLNDKVTIIDIFSKSLKLL